MLQDDSHVDNQFHTVLEPTEYNENDYDQCLKENDEHVNDEIEDENLELNNLIESLNTTEVQKTIDVDKPISNTDNSIIISKENDERENTKEDIVNLIIYNPIETSIKDYEESHGRKLHDSENPVNQEQWIAESIKGEKITDGEDQRNTEKIRDRDKSLNETDNLEEREKTTMNKQGVVPNRSTDSNSFKQNTTVDMPLYNNKNCIEFWMPKMTKQYKVQWQKKLNKMGLSCFLCGTSQVESEEQ